MHKSRKSRNSMLRIGEPSQFETLTLKAMTGYRIQQIQDLTDRTYILRFNRNNIVFRAGQHITLGLPGDNQIREYSIYSNIHEPYLDVLIREVDEGLVSKRLHRVSKGDILQVDGPFGFFTLNESKVSEQSYLFIATGTGIAPFHSIVGSYPDLNYHVLHGVRYKKEAYGREAFLPGRYTLCTSGEAKGNFHGRVTDYLALQDKVDSNTLVYLCGNVEMIYEVYDILTSQGLNPDQIRTEVYF
jgi:ferredoxin/flavodoxin---NADP+ reductase